MMRLVVLLVTGVSALKHAVVIQNKGGGHGEIGYHVCKKLKEKGIEKVTLLQDETTRMDSLPFCHYDELDVNLKVCDLKNPPAFDLDVTHIFDNYSKSPSDVEPFLRKDSNFQLYTYVSSAGMYVSKGILKETDEVKDSGQRQVEVFLEEELPSRFVSFRPQYIYGPYTNKRDYIDWFLLRIANNKPLAVPGDGQQPVSLTHCEDVAELLTSVLGKEGVAAEAKIFNCGTDKLISYGELCTAAAKALNKDAALVATLAPDSKSSFPFRSNAEGFAVSVRKAKQILGWPGAKHNVVDDLIGGFYTDAFLSLDPPPTLDTSKDLLDQAANLDYLSV